ncbi:hypothetical protein BGZ95_000313 [Linnemannia exigua]|uniref:PX domain-containing protein n=1 Tax=Linnemannia exigua TaxID=604196 RepID=A0AAD4H4I6_9FUNG|nr:hypothetical protein BGZ95_000313 [Linnemannia exigua]
MAHTKRTQRFFAWIDKLLGEIEDAEGTLTPEEEAQRSEQCQQAIDLRRNVWETSKLLKSALDHVEEIDDEDEARILREPMDALQVHVKKALQTVTSAADTKTSRVSGTPSTGATAATVMDTPSKALPIPTGFVARSAAGTAMPSGTPPGLSGSLNRHPLGLFSTSPSFGAQSPFASPKRLSAARFPSTPIVAASDVEAETETEEEAETPLPAVVKSNPLSKASSTNINKSNSKTKEYTSTVQCRPGTTSGLSAVSIDEGPLSIAATPAPTPVKSTVRSTRVAASPHSSATSSSLSSAASYSTPITSPLNTPVSPPTVSPGNLSLPRNIPKQSATADDKAVASESKVPKSLEAVCGPKPVRRVPRGLFSTSSTTSTSGSEPSSRIPGFGSLSITESNSNSSVIGQGHGNGTFGHSFGKTPVASMDQIVTTLAQEPLDSPTRGRTPTRVLSPGFLSASRPQSPLTPSTPTGGPKSPPSPRLQRSQPKPSPIQTAPTSPATDLFPRNGTANNREEQMSQLAKDLERAMNPTPTEPVPQPYFLQGKGLLERIPNQDSVDEDDQYFEDSDGNDGQTGQDGASGLSRGGGSLRRQRSGSKRRFRIARSRSRNRSKSRQERNKPDLIPIEIGYTSALASSEWPFDKAPTLPPSQTSLSALQQQQLQRQRNAALAGGAGPRLPFAESVTVSNPIRVGRGIGSFTVYNVSLTLCDPAKAKVPLPPRQGQTQSQGINRENAESISLTGHDQHDSSALHAGHATVQGSEDSVNFIAPPATSSTDTTAGPLRPPPSKAALMMTRSLSFPELGDSAERLLKEMRSMEDENDSPLPQLPFRPTTPLTTAAPLATRPSPANGDSPFSLPPLLRPQSAPISSPPLPTFRGLERGGMGPLGLDATLSRAASAQQVTAAHGQGYVSPPIPTRVVTGFTPGAPTSSSSSMSTSVPAPPRVIHVRKRYTDFVTLRAQLVETFREPRRGGIRNARRLFSRSSSSVSVPGASGSGGGYPSFGGAPVSGGHRVSPLMSNDEDEDYHDEDDEDGDEDGAGYAAAHSRVASSASLASNASSAGGSIITRGMPKLPPKKVVGKFRPAFVEKRRRELEYFLEWVVAHPVMGDSPVVVQWFLGPTASPTI